MLAWHLPGCARRSRSGLALHRRSSVFRSRRTERPCASGDARFFLWRRGSLARSLARFASCAGIASRAGPSVTGPGTIGFSLLHAEDAPITTSCHADWDDMDDHGRFRHCAGGDKPVYDLAQHTEREIRALIAAGACRRVSLYADGTLATRESEPLPSARLLCVARAAAIALPLAACGRAPLADPSPGRDTVKPSVSAESVAPSVPTAAPSASETPVPTPSSSAGIRDAARSASLPASPAPACTPRKTPPVQRRNGGRKIDQIDMGF